LEIELVILSCEWEKGFAVSVYKHPLFKVIFLCEYRIEPLSYLFSDKYLKTAVALPSAWVGVFAKKYTMLL